jgi:hypothetical protein
MMACSPVEEACFGCKLAVVSLVLELCDQFRSVIEACLAVGWDRTVRKQYIKDKNENHVFRTPFETAVIFMTAGPGAACQALPVE